MGCLQFSLLRCQRLSPAQKAIVVDVDWGNSTWHVSRLQFSSSTHTRQFHRSKAHNSLFHQVRFLIPPKSVAPAQHSMAHTRVLLDSIVVLPAYHLIRAQKQVHGCSEHGLGLLTDGVQPSKASIGGGAVLARHPSRSAY